MPFSSLRVGIYLGSAKLASIEQVALQLLILETYIKPIKLPHPRFYLKTNQKLFAHQRIDEIIEKKKREETLHHLCHESFLYAVLTLVENGDEVCDEAKR